MNGLVDSLLQSVGGTIETVFWESLGLASQGGVYEPEMSDEANEFKNTHVSRVEKMYNKIMHK